VALLAECRDDLAALVGVELAAIGGGCCCHFVAPSPSPERGSTAEKPL